MFRVEQRGISGDKSRDVNAFSGVKGVFVSSLPWPGFEGASRGGEERS